MGDRELVDTMIKDGLWDAFNGYHMGNTAENVAEKYEITREQQDEFAVPAEQGRGGVKSGRFKDEIVRSRSRAARATRWSTRRVPALWHDPGAVAKLRPAFAKDGTVTAGNASGINDGAAAVVLMSAKEAERRGIKPLARIVSWAHAGVDPVDHGHRPDPRLAQGARARRLVGRRPRPDRGQRGVRRAGLRRQQGSGLGHRQGERQRRRDRARPPDRRVGRARLCHLLHEMIKRDAKKGLATLCIGGGMGIAMCVARD